MYKDMLKILSPRESNKYILDYFVIDDRNNDWQNPLRPGTYVRLMEKGMFGDVVMSDTPMEKRTNQSFVTNAHGDILIGGLGIGMVLLAIQDKPNVRSITVIEKNREILDMILPQLPLNNKVRVIEGDIFDWTPDRGSKYDVIYFDIWNYTNVDVYEEMKTLKKKYRGRLRDKKENSDSFMSCWAEWEAKNNSQLR